MHLRIAVMSLRPGIERAAAVVRQWAATARQADPISSGPQVLCMTWVAGRLDAEARAVDRAWAPTSQPAPQRQPVDDTAAQQALF